METLHKEGDDNDASVTHRKFHKVNYLDWLIFPFNDVHRDFVGIITQQGPSVAVYSLPHHEPTIYHLKVTPTDRGMILMDRLLFFLFLIIVPSDTCTIITQLEQPWAGG